MRINGLLLKLACALIALSATASSQTVERDVAYGNDPRQRLDVYLPSGKQFTTVVFVHGGSFETGDKADDDYRGVCPALVNEGFACVSINYRMFDTDQWRWPAPAEDTAAATAWVQHHISTRGGNATKIFLFGHSSGARLVTLIGTDASYLKKYDMKPSDLQGVIGAGSIMWDEEFEQAAAQATREQIEKGFASDRRWYGNVETYRDSWPMKHVGPGLPPMLLLVAESEEEQPPVLRHAQTFTGEMRKNGNCAEYRILPGRTHMATVRRFGEKGDPALAAVVEFVTERR